MSDDPRLALRIEAAVVSGDVDALRDMFGGDPAFPNVRDECGQTVLDHAIYRGPPALVRALLDLGADPNYADAGGFPSLFAAVDRATDDRYEVLALLLAAGASVAQRGTNDYTPLHYAACRDDARAVELLLRHGADRSARTRIDHYATPLEEAEQFGHRLGAEALRRFSPDEEHDVHRA
jgi:ankyrin repeat protein